MISEDSSLAGFFLSLSFSCQAQEEAAPPSHMEDHEILGKIYPRHDSCIRQSPTALPDTAYVFSSGSSEPSLQELLYYTRFLQDVSVQQRIQAASPWDTDGTR